MDGFKVLVQAVLLQKLLVMMCNPASFLGMRSRQILCERFFIYACVRSILDPGAGQPIPRMRVEDRLAQGERIEKYHVDGEWEYSAGPGLCRIMIEKEVII